MFGPQDHSYLLVWIPAGIDCACDSSICWRQYGIQSTQFALWGFYMAVLVGCGFQTCPH